MKPARKYIQISEKIEYFFNNRTAACAAEKEEKESL